MFMRFEKIDAKPKLAFPPQRWHATVPDVLADTEQKRACKDCRHFTSWQRCSNPKYLTFDEVHGWQDSLCRMLRSNDTECGKGGAGWQGYTLNQVPGRIVDKVWPLAAILAGLAMIGWVFFR